MQSGMRDELNEALKQLDRVALVYPRIDLVREHVDAARSRVVSALLEVLRREANELREHLSTEIG